MNTRFIEQRLVRVALGEVLGQQEPLLVVVLLLCGQLGDLGERRQEQVQTSVPREEEQLEEPRALAHKFLVSLKNVEVLSSWVLSSCVPLEVLNISVPSIQVLALLQALGGGKKIFPVPVHCNSPHCTYAVWKNGILFRYPLKLHCRSLYWSHHYRSFYCF
jgi:hypothetical protein